MISFHCLAPPLHDALWPTLTHLSGLAYTSFFREAPLIVWVWQAASDEALTDVHPLAIMPLRNPTPRVWAGSRACF